MPTSTPEARVVGVTGNIVSVESEAPLMKNAIAFAYSATPASRARYCVGRRADLQIFEETQGVRVGDPVGASRARCCPPRSGQACWA